MFQGVHRTLSFQTFRHEEKSSWEGLNFQLQTHTLLQYVSDVTAQTFFLPNSVTTLPGLCTTVILNNSCTVGYRIQLYTGHGGWLKN